MKCRIYIWVACFWFIRWHSLAFSFPVWRWMADVQGENVYSTTIFSILIIFLWSITKLSTASRYCKFHDYKKNYFLFTCFQKFSSMLDKTDSLRIQWIENYGATFHFEDITKWDKYESLQQKFQHKNELIMPGDIRKIPIWLVWNVNSRISGEYQPRH